MLASRHLIGLASLTILAFWGCSGSSPSPELPKLEAELLPVQGSVWSGDREPISVSPDGRYLVFWRERTSDGGPDGPLYGLTFLDLENKRVLPVAVGESARELVEHNLGPGPGSICRGAEGQVAYFDGQYDRAALSESLTKRPRTRPPKYAFQVAYGSTEELRLEVAESLPCRPGATPEHEIPIPPVKIEQVSDRSLRIVRDDKVLAEHQPRRSGSKRIGAFQPGVDNGWSRDFRLSPDGRFLAYKISETNRMGFAAPNQSYLLDLAAGEAETRLYDLGLEVYSFVWHPDSRELFATVKGSAEGAGVARWRLPKE